MLKNTRKAAIFAIVSICLSILIIYLFTPDSVLCRLDLERAQTVRHKNQ
ncbi:hypothetical protein CFter6_3940 [Collimonas fungivorans]|uniref:Hok/gef family protein n=1 Tax=Collimonas fungivorans TaxID=158899 RepID=A0A127PFN8_9BURK|nr:hypothetical protein CFter6_3940 [Collimonas fungivorans]